MIKQNHSNLGLNKKVQKKFQNCNNEGNSTDNVDPDYNYLNDNQHSIDIMYLDVYISYVYRNKVTKPGNDVLKKAYGAIEGVLSDTSKIEEDKKNDIFFDYERLCSEEYDLTPDEKTMLWDINGYCVNCMGRNKIGDLYKTTKVILSTEDNAKEYKRGDDLLGFYTISSKKCPQVWLLMDKITEEAKRLGCNRMYVTAAVYIHEMMHRFFDVRPDLGWKRSVKEIEEPMAEFAKLSFCEEFCKDQRHCMYIKLLPIALKLTENLRNHDMHFIYALGADMYYNQEVKINLICKYRHVSLLMMHQVPDKDKAEEGGLTPFKNPVNEYLENNECTKENLKNLVEPLCDLINQYSKWFPIKKYSTK